MPPGFTKFFAERLSSKFKFHIKEAEEVDSIKSNSVLLAPGGGNMTVGTDKKIHLNKDSTLHGVRPAVDPTMETAANVFGSETIGVLLTEWAKTAR
jgi:two-component system chemotaxis response regulator CheB